MTIRKGEAWGHPVERPGDLVVAHDDAELARLIDADPDGAYTVDGGDLFRALGAPRTGGSTVQRLPIDLLEIETDGHRRLAVAHVVLRRRWWRGWWRGPIVFVCNVDHIGTWYIAPRAHPNDGRFDVVTVDARMPFRARWEARRRLPTGTHVPHPSISVRTSTQWNWGDDRGVRVIVDGVDVGVQTEVTIRLRPDAGAIHV